MHSRYHELTVIVGAGGAVNTTQFTRKDRSYPQSWGARCWVTALIFHHRDDWQQKLQEFINSLPVPDYVHELQQNLAKDRRRRRERAALPERRKQQAANARGKAADQYARKQNTKADEQIPEYKKERTVGPEPEPEVDEKEEQATAKRKKRTQKELQEAWEVRSGKD